MKTCTTVDECGMNPSAAAAKHKARIEMLQYSYRPQFPPTQRTRSDVDQSWIDYLPITERPPLVWPGNARLAVMVCPNVLYYELMPPSDPWINPWARMTPDVMMYGRQEFGSRVGFWRLLNILDKHNVPCTAVLNVAALAKFPDIRAAIVERKWDLLGHGMYNTRFICGLGEEEERAYYLEMLRITRELTGIEMKGMGGPGPQAATENTPDLLAGDGLPLLRGFLSRRSTVSNKRKIRKADLDALFGRDQRRANFIYRL